MPRQNSWMSALERSVDVDVSGAKFGKYFLFSIGWSINGRGRSELNSFQSSVSGKVREKDSSQATSFSLSVLRAQRRAEGLYRGSTTLDQVLTEFRESGLC